MTLEESLPLGVKMEILEEQPLQRGSSSIWGRRKGDRPRPLVKNS